MTPENTQAVVVDVRLAVDQQLIPAWTRPKGPGTASMQFTVEDLEAMRMLRRLFDPELRCNPHKMFPGSKRCSDFAPRKQAAA